MTRQKAIQLNSCNSKQTSVGFLMYKRIGLTAVDLAAIDRVIDAQGITEFRARDIMVPTGEYEPDQEDEPEGYDQRDLKHRRVGNVTIERGQYIPELRMGKLGERGSKIVGAVQFIYPGGEFGVITAAVEPVARMLHKLHLHGNFHVNDALLSNIASAFPLLRSVRFETQQEQPTPITSQGLTAFVSSLMRLEVLRLSDLCSSINHLPISSSTLRKIHLTGFLALQTFSLKVPTLVHLRLEGNPAAPVSLSGIATTLASLRELQYLHLGHCIHENKEVQALALSKLHSFGVSSSTMTPETVTCLLSLLHWKVLSSLDLACILTDAHLSPIAALGYASLKSLHLRTMPGSSLTATAIGTLIKGCAVLSTLHIHDDMLTTLTVKSGSLSEVLIGGTQLVQLYLDCPSLDVVHLQSCPQLRPVNFSLSCNQLSDAQFDDTVDIGVASLIVPFVQKQQEAKIWMESNGKRTQ